jgi:hypothetical protein
MTNLGVFRDDFYNAVHVLAASQSANGPTGTGTLTAAQISGAGECTVAVGNGAGAAQTYTTDTAANIIANLNAAVQAAAKANVGGFSASLGAQPAVSGIPNFFNFTWTMTISNQGTTAASVLAGGTGVTLTNLNAGLVATNIPLGAPNAPTGSRWVCQVTSPTTITMTRVE